MKMAKKIILTNGVKVLVDEEDYDYLLEYNWRELKNGKTSYAIYGKRINGKYKNVWMHRMIMGVTDRKEEINHIDHNGLNNQKHNLRKTTHKNVVIQRNGSEDKSSKYKGVSLYKPTNKWRARILINGKLKYLGYYTSEIHAAKAYDKAQIKYFGEYSNLNFNQAL